MSRGRTGQGGRAVDGDNQVTQRGEISTQAPLAGTDVHGRAPEAEPVRAIVDRGTARRSRDRASEPSLATPARSHPRHREVTRPHSRSPAGVRTSVPAQGGSAKLACRRGAEEDAVCVLLRRAEPGDEYEVAQVHVRSWQAAYRGLLPDDYLDALDPADRAPRYAFAEVRSDRPHTTVAVDEAGICGFATIGPCRDPDSSGAGELYAIYVDPDWWDRGVGRMLIQDARRRLVDHGFSDAVLWVLVGNERAERFYRVDGWTPDGQRRLQDVHGITVDETRYTRPIT